MSGRGVRDESGQMVVEMAVVLPALIVFGLVVYNLCSFVSLCARFDQVACDQIVAIGTSPSGEQSRISAVEEVREGISEVMGDSERVTVEVNVEGVYEGGSGSTFAVSPLLERYTATLTYRPWPGSLVLAGISLDAPLALRHERALVIDRFKPGVVV